MSVLSSEATSGMPVPCPFLATVLVNASVQRLPFKRRHEQHVGVAAYQETGSPVLIVSHREKKKARNSNWPCQRQSSNLKQAWWRPSPVNRTEMKRRLRQKTISHRAPFRTLLDLLSTSVAFFASSRSSDFS